MIEIGSLIDGKYKILNKIGEGGMSVVYLAMNERVNKQWAIKEVRKEGVKDFEVVKQSLIAEIELLKKLSHPNIPSIVDVIETDGMFLVVMDYIEGITLSKALEEEGPQEQEDVIAWAMQLCDVLEYLHTRTPPIIYRDTKPANIMLKPDGNIMLIDFGTAREFKESNEEDTTCLGTHRYAAPEQFGGQGQTDARTDIYNLGATLFHLVTGIFPNGTPSELTPIREINPTLSRGLEFIIKKCTQYRPEDRYQSCTQIMYALEHIDEIDEKYRGGQKKRLCIFTLSFLVAIVSLCLALLMNSIGFRIQKNIYKDTLESARRESDSNSRIQMLYDAIEIDPSQKEAYVELIQEYYTSNGFAKSEEIKVREILQTVSESRSKTNIEYLKERPEDYAEVAFELGTAYWYYFYAKESRRKQATVWFEDAVNYGLSDESKLRKAELFYRIGNFHKNIDLLQSMGDDKGEYLKYWESLTSLKQEYETYGEYDAILVQLYKEINVQIVDYGDYFKNDGVEYKSIEAVLESIKRNIPKIEVVDDDKKKELEDLKESISTTQIELENTYKRVGGEDDGG